MLKQLSTEVETMLTDLNSQNAQIKTVLDLLHRSKSLQLIKEEKDIDNANNKIKKKTMRKCASCTGVSASNA